jgi:hypothetical protein
MRLIGRNYPLTVMFEDSIPVQHVQYLRRGQQQSDDAMTINNIMML